jgi:hypothetical protein
MDRKLPELSITAKTIKIPMREILSPIFSITVC